jgi:peptidyl-prolyl cis-trans isomerase C/foldase protein PrsA
MVTIAVALALALAAWAGGCGRELPAGVVAEVDGRPVSLEEFKAQAAFMGLGGDPRKLAPELRRAVLESLIRRRLVAARAQELSISLEPEELGREERLLRQGLDPAAFEQGLAAQGLGYGQWRRMLARELLVRKTLELVVAPRVQVSADEVAAYYHRHRREFRRPAQVLAQHAVLPRRGLAAELVERVGRGQDLARAAAELGAPLAEGGEPTWLSRGHMPEDLEERIFALEPGRLAGPLASDYGFHVVRVVDKRPAREVPLAQAAETIQRRLTARKVEELADGWIDELRGQAQIRLSSRFLEQGRTDGLRR